MAGDDPTLFEWAGGQPVFDGMINAFYDRVESDDPLSPFFTGGVHEDHRRHVAVWWGEVFGGPTGYTDRLGGYERMVHKHLGLGTRSIRGNLAGPNDGSDHRGAGRRCGDSRWPSSERRSPGRSAD